jgi:hypothetical protein
MFIRIRDFYVISCDSHKGGKYQLSLDLVTKVGWYFLAVHTLDNAMDWAKFISYRSDILHSSDN